MPEVTREMVVCGRCGTEMAPHALACSACSALLHRERLEQLASLAEAATASDPALARSHWEEALRLVPFGSKQHRQIGERLTALGPSTPEAVARGAGGLKWGGVLGVGGTVAVLLVGKVKFLLLGLSKLSTVASMFGFIAVYWAIHGWPLAVGIAVAIYIHEMGHMSMLRQLGIDANAPLFIPGVGALVMLKQHVTDPVVDARIGLAGPVWGLGATVVAFAAYLLSGASVLLAIAEISGFLNLFNLMPIWQLDGSRGFNALSQAERGLVVAAIAATLWLTAVPILWFVGAIALYRTIWTEPGPGHAQTATTFVGLVGALSWFARTLH